MFSVCRRVFSKNDFKRCLSDESSVEVLFVKWQATHPSWLFVFDNVTDKKVVENYIAKTHHGHILFTSRKQEIPGLLIYNTFNIDVFTFEEALTFMRDRLSKNMESLANNVNLAALVERLGCFPLALEQAAAYINRTKITCGQYMDLLSNKGMSALEHYLAEPMTDYKRAVTETIELSVNSLKESSRQLFNICSHMGPERIPLALIISNAPKLPKPLCVELLDKMEVDVIISELLNGSLISKNGDSISIHRFVQEIGRELTKNDDVDWLKLSFSIFQEMIIGDIVESCEGVEAILLNNGMHCLGCPAAKGETILEACQVHGIDINNVLSEINALFFKQNSILNSKKYK